MPPENPNSFDVQMGDFYESEHRNFDNFIKTFDAFIASTKNELISFLKKRGSKNLPLVREGIVKIKNIHDISFVEEIHKNGNTVMGQYHHSTNKIILNKSEFSKMKEEILLKELKTTFIHELIHASGIDEQEIGMFFSEGYDLSNKNNYQLNQTEVVVRGYETLIYIKAKYGMVDGEITPKDIDFLYQNLDSFPNNIKALLQFYFQNNKKYKLLELLNDGLAKNQLNNKLVNDLEQIV